MRPDKQKLAVIALGKANAGKSSTSDSIFGRTIRAEWKYLNYSTSTNNEK